MAQYDLNVIVCTDPRRCADASVIGHAGNGCAGEDLVGELRQVVQDNGLLAQVRMTECRCIFGCTYGPRIDVARRWRAEKLIYGIIDADVFISRRGQVGFTRIPNDLSRLIFDNLPQDKT